MDNSASFATEYGQDWQCGSNYIEPLKSLVCDDYPCSSICEPKNFTEYNAWAAKLPDFGVASFSGPDKSAQRAAACAFYGDSSE